MPPPTLVCKFLLNFSISRALCIIPDELSQSFEECENDAIALGDIYFILYIRSTSAHYAMSAILIS